MRMSVNALNGDPHAPSAAWMSGTRNGMTTATTPAAANRVGGKTRSSGSETTNRKLYITRMIRTGVPSIWSNPPSKKMQHARTRS